MRDFRKYLRSAWRPVILLAFAPVAYTVMKLMSLNLDIFHTWWFYTYIIINCCFLIYSLLAVKHSSRRKQLAETQSAISANPSFRFADGILGDDDTRHCNKEEISAKDGEVIYYTEFHTQHRVPYIIGYYDKCPDADGCTYIYDNERFGKIGAISAKGHVSFLLEASYQKYKSSTEHFYTYIDTDDPLIRIKKPSPDAKEVAIFSAGSAYAPDADRKLIGNYNGKAVECAAIFVCMVYSLVKEECELKGFFRGYVHDHIELIN